MLVRLTLLVFHLMGSCLMDRRHCFSHDDTPIDNEKFALNTLTIEHDVLTNFVVTLDRLMVCDFVITRHSEPSK